MAKPSQPTARRSRTISASDAMTALKSGQRIFIGANCAEPETLVAALSTRAPQLTNVEVVQLLALGEQPYACEARAKNIRYNALFIGPGVRNAVNEGWAEYTPVFLSEIPNLFRRNEHLPIDIAMIAVSPPDEHGFCSYGLSVDITKPAAEAASIVIAEMNHHVPRTLGDAFIHISQIDHIVESDRPLREIPRPRTTALHQKIAYNVASLIDDGATLQLGIGAIPNAVLSALEGRQKLGIHTEMFSDGVMEAFETGIIDNSAKTLHPGKLVTSFVMGSRSLYDFIDNNPCVEMRPSDYTNDPYIIARNNKMIAINSAISVDLTGQVNSDSIGTRLYSGIGGQVDFIRGAARAPGGKPIIALPSMARDASRIVSSLAEGSGVVTSRGDVHYIITEYGIADLYARTIRDRAKALINIAHPDVREELSRAARAHKYLRPYD